MPQAFLAAKFHPDYVARKIAEVEKELARFGGVILDPSEAIAIDISYVFEVFDFPIAAFSGRVYGFLDLGKTFEFSRLFGEALDLASGLYSTSFWLQLRELRAKRVQEIYL